MRSDHVETLLRDYEICEASARGLEGPIWQSASIIGLGGIAALALLANQDPLSLLVLGFAVVLLNFLWWWVVRRWWAIQHSHRERMLAIEHDVPQLKRVSCVSYLDAVHQRKFLCLLRRKAEYRRQLVHLRHSLNIDSLLARRLRKIPYQRRGPLEILGCVRWVTLLGWLFLTINAFGR